MPKLVLVVVLLLVIGVFRSVQAQDDVIRVNTTLVSVPVIVSDRDGRYIPDLKRSDFSLARDGANQKIDFFASIEEPINVAILIDTSHSTRPVLDEIKKAAERFIRVLGPRDKAAVVSFDYDTHLLSPLTTNIGQLKRAIKDAEIPKLAGTTLRDAVGQTVSEQFSGVTGRKAIILLTDGKDVGSQIRPQELIRSLEESDVMIYSIFFKTGMGMGNRGRGMGRLGGGVFGPRFPPNDRFPGPRRGDPSRRAGAVDPQRQQRIEENNERAEDYLQQLSDVTAGRFYNSDGSKFSETFDLIADELRHQYRLGFYPPEETGPAAIHELRIKVNRPDVVVRARSSYRTTSH